MKLAIFDIDGTITNKSSERFFIKYLLERKIIGYGHLVKTFFLFVMKHPLQARTGFKQNKMYLRDLSDKALRLAAAECFKRSIKPNIKQTILDEINERKSRGYKILLLSGSLPCLVEPMLDHTGADHMICSDVEISNGLFTGHMTDLHPYGPRKRILAERFCQRNGYRMDQSCAYANEWADRFLLESVGEAVAVDPDEKLRKLADSKKWKMIKS